VHQLQDKFEGLENNIFVRGKDFIEIMKSIKSDLDVTLSTNYTHLDFAAGRTKGRLALITDFVDTNTMTVPDFLEANKLPNWVVSNLVMCSLGTTDQYHNPIVGTIYCDEENMYATDMARATRCCHPEKIGHRILVPIDFIKLIEKQVDSVEQVYLAYDLNHMLVVRLGDNTYALTSLEDPDKYQVKNLAEVFPGPDDGIKIEFAEHPKEVFARHVKFVKRVRGYKRAVITVEKDVFTITSIRSNGRVSDKMKLKEVLEATKIKFEINPVFLEKVLDDTAEIRYIMRSQNSSLISMKVNNIEYVVASYES
jgi:hypothetical protein